jgi:hypothetical protein
MALSWRGAGGLRSSLVVIVVDRGLLKAAMAEQTPTNCIAAHRFGKNELGRESQRQATEATTQQQCAASILLDCLPRGSRQ